MAIKVSSVWPVNELGEILVQSGTGTDTVTGFISQDQIPTDDSTNKAVLKFNLDAAVLSETLTGFASATGTITAADTVLSALQKLYGNNALKALNLLTGYSSGAGTVAATDTVLQAIQKLNGNAVAQTAKFTLGVATPSADGILTGFSFAHGHATTPTHVSLTAKSVESSGLHYVTWDATDITVTYAVAPALSTLSFSFEARN